MFSNHEKPAEQPFSMHQLYAAGDRLMSKVQWSLLLLAFLLASWHGTWAEAIIIGLPAALVPTLLTLMQPGNRLTRTAHGLAFMIFAALHIHQAHGMIEVHFGIFVFLAFLLYYRDWLPVVAAAGLIAVHHLLFNFLQESGTGVYVFADRTGLDIVLIHAAYVVFETVILVIMAVKGQREGRQSEEVAALASRLTATDGQVHLAAPSTTANSRIGRGISAFVHQLLQTLQKTRAASDHLTGSLPETLQRLEKTAALTRQQEEELTQLVSAVNQMTTSFREVSDNAQLAADTASASEEQAQQGQQNLGKTLEGIHQLVEQFNRTSQSIILLKEDSNNIGGVLDVIRKIAEQTNLLALNAAIEAARAGDTGRGFAVVADEVRNLASSTHKSTEEISQMITSLQQRSDQAVTDMQTSQREVTLAMEQIQATSDALGTILRGISTINGMNMQIAGATEQQSAVAEEINRNITAIGELAAEAGQEMTMTLNASREMQQLSSQLDQAIKAFHLS